MPLTQRTKSSVRSTKIDPDTQITKSKVFIKQHKGISEQEFYSSNDQMPHPIETSSIEGSDKEL